MKTAFDWLIFVIFGVISESLTETMKVVLAAQLKKVKICELKFIHVPWNIFTLLLWAASQSITTA